MVNNQKALSPPVSLSEIIGNTETRLADTDSQLFNIDKDAQLLQNELDNTKKQVEELNQSSRHWRTVNDGLNKKLISLTNSYSWAITAPFRFVLRVKTHLYRFPKKIFKVIYKFTRKIIRKTFILFGRRILKINWIAVPVKKILRRFPGIFKRLHKMLGKSAVFSTTINRQLNSDNISPCAKKIYIDLLKEIEEGKRRLRTTLR